MVYFDEFDGEVVTYLTGETKFKIKKVYFDKMLLGFNIIANNEILETKSTKKKAEKFIKKLKNKIKIETQMLANADKH